MQTSIIRPRRPSDLDLGESPLIFACRSLLVPVVPVVTLAACIRLGNEALHGGYIVVATLTFLQAPQFLGRAHIDAHDSSQHTGGRSAAELIVRWLTLLALVGLLTYLSGLGHSLNYNVLAAWAVVTPLALRAAELAARTWLSGVPLASRPPKRAVIVGVTEVGVRLEEALRAATLLNIKTVGYFEDRPPERLTAARSAPILGLTGDLAAYVASHHIERVYITLPMNRDARILGLLEQLRDSTASIYFTPDLLAYHLLQARFDVLQGIPLVAVCETPIYGAARLAKRIFDLLIAGTALVALLPVLILVAICIRLESRGPLIFKQKRYGLDGREILVYKFRSMTVTEDGKSHFTAACRNDRRITRVGAFIRRTSIDELPQLFNVLEGSMSIVGPRPHPVAMNEHYRREIPGYMVRHKVKPGITGWAQVHGYRGGDDLESMRKRIEFDLDYLENWSLRLDLLILLKTVAVVWTDRHAY